ncbi:SDR family NAD(P)-dependent oxidoreductase [Sphingomonas adhaesiva]|uniref:SDR family NAD(P)-dependent oxidoreductase n=1 Tax=Sphingomonas adhaesiva TaxID=28212 RepID=UPI002FFA63BE
MALLDGKVAIVTGGGRGIGRAHSLALARAGAAVVVNDLGAGFDGEGAADGGPAQQVVAEIVAAGGRAVADTTDISDWDAAAAIVEAAVRAFGRLDIVVNNAGIARFGSIDQVSRRDWEQTIAVNLTGTAALSHWAAKHWRERGPEAGRRIVNTSSGVGLTPIPGNPMYVAAKAGVAGLTISCAIELAELGVRVNGIAPVARSRISEHVAGEMMSQVPEGFDRVSPEHAATVATYLASPACRFTGRVIGVVGDDITLFDGWTVSRHVDNGERPWTPEGLAAALADFPEQQDGRTQGIKGLQPNPTPAPALIEALAAIERA